MTLQDLRLRHARMSTFEKWLQRQLLLTLWRTAGLLLCPARSAAFAQLGRLTLLIKAAGSGAGAVIAARRNPTPDAQWFVTHQLTNGPIAGGAGLGLSGWQQTGSRTGSSSRRFIVQRLRLLGYVGHCRSGTPDVSQRGKVLIDLHVFIEMTLKYLRMWQ